MRNIFMPFLLALFLIPAAVGAEKQLGVDEYKSVEEFADVISSYFPKVQGEVKTVQGDKLTISLGKKDGLMPGMILTLWREGKEILHPVTGAQIGRTEEEVGSIEVLSVEDVSSTAAVKKKLKEPRQGDKARITPKKIHIAVIPVRAGHEEIVSGIANHLTESGRFTVLDAEKTGSFLKDKNQKDAALIREMGRSFNLDAVAAVGVYPSEGKLLVTVRILYPEEAKPLNTIAAMLDLTSKKQPLGEIMPFFARVKEKSETTPELPFAARFFAVAELDGDGKTEYVFSDGRRLSIYRLEPSGWQELWTEAAPQATTDMRHIYLDTADINGNGRAEIFITSMVEGKVVSSVFEFQEGTYRRISEFPGFLRVLNFPGRGIILTGQDYYPATFYAGQPRQYVWSAGNYVPGTELAIPKGVGLYGFVLADLGEQNPLAVSLDEKDHIQVYSRDTLIWKSEERYLSVETIVYKPVTRIETVLGKSSADDDKARRVRITGRLAAQDVDGDGKDEIVLPKNIGSAFFGGFKKAEMDAMAWTGARLEQKWNMDVPGAVLDFQVVKDDKTGIQIFALVKTKGGLFSKDSVRVMSYSVR